MTGHPEAVGFSEKSPQYLGIRPEHRLSDLASRWRCRGAWMCQA